MSGDDGGMRTPRPWALPSEPAPVTALAGQGVTRRMIATQLAAGRLIRVRQSVFLGAEYWPADAAGQHLVRARAETVVNPEAAISHASAALVWQLPTPTLGKWDDAPVTVTLPGDGRHRSRRGPVAHRLGPLPAGHLTRDASGYRVTTVARTAIDLARGLAIPEALVVLDTATRCLCASYVAKPRRADYSNVRHRSRAVEELEDVASNLWRRWIGRGPGAGRAGEGVAGGVTDSRPHPPRPHTAAAVSGGGPHTRGDALPRLPLGGGTPGR